MRTYYPPTTPQPGLVTETVIASQVLGQDGEKFTISFLRYCRQGAYAHWGDCRHPFGVGRTSMPRRKMLFLISICS